MLPKHARGHPVSRQSAQAALFYTHIDSPIGPLLVAGTAGKLHFLSFSTGHKAFEALPDWRRDHRPFQEAARQIRAYFAGTLTTFDLHLHLDGTDFQKQVWSCLANIPFGETRTYGEIATDIGRPKAGRAVGAANGNNPLPLILPCHRVIGRNGALTGFGGGLPLKRYLLQLEGAIDEPEATLKN